MINGNACGLAAGTQRLDAPENESEENGRKCADLAESNPFVGSQGRLVVVVGVQADSGRMLCPRNFHYC